MNLIRIYFFVIIACILGVISCKKKDSVSLANKWKVESVLETYDSIIKVAPANTNFEFTNDFKIIFSGDDFTCNSSFDVDGVEMKIDSIICDTCCINKFQIAIQKRLHKVKTYKIIGENLYLYGEEELTIKSSLK